MRTVFLSYAINRDGPFVRELKATNTDFKFFDFAEDMSQGRDVSGAMWSALHQSDVVLALLSADDANVLVEVGLALGSRKPTLLVIQATTPVPFELRAVQCVVRSGNLEQDVAEIYARLDEMPPSPEKVIPSFATPREMLATYHTNPEYFESIEPQQFEMTIKNWFEASGIQTETPNEAESGYDFVFTSPNTGQRFLVEAKKSSPQNRISVKEINTLVSTVASTGAHGAFLISNSEFTNSARDVANSSEPPLVLFSMDNLLQATDAKQLLVDQA